MQDVESMMVKTSRPRTEASTVFSKEAPGEVLPCVGVEDGVEVVGTGEPCVPTRT